MSIPLVDNVKTQVLRYLPSATIALPTSVKLALVAWLAINFQTFPGRWHLTVLYPWIKWMLLARLGRPTPPVSIDHPDPRTYSFSRDLYSGPGLADAFGFHLSNSSYAWAADHVRGPHVYTLLPTVLALKGVYFALGATTFKFMKQIEINSTFTVTQELVAYDKKWLYFLTSFTTIPKKGQAPIVHATSLSHVVLKAGRRTIIPARAIALSGFGKNGKLNSTIVDQMSPKQRAKWLIGEDEEKIEIQVGELEMGLDGKVDWPGAVVV